MENLEARIAELKRKRKAIILAHNYQLAEVQDIADYVGDSFELSRKAAAAQAEVIVLAGVHFMAESAALLAPGKTVLLPDPQAGCPLADCVEAPALRKKREEYPEAAVVCYVNTSASVKAESDICCTSSNAVAVVNALSNPRILFVPDQNLASFVAGSTDKEVIPWNGFCPTHYHLTLEDLERARAAHGGAVTLVHPECCPEVVRQADFVGSTGAILRFARESEAREFLIGTEVGIIHRLQLENPEKQFHPISDSLVCPTMKLNTLEKIARSLEEMQTVVRLPQEIVPLARRSLEKMLEVT